MAEGIHDEEDDTYSAPGTAAHKLSGDCLEIGTAPWLYVGGYVEDRGDGDLFTRDEDGAVPENAVPVTQEMANGAQVYIDALAEAHPVEDRNQGNTFIERRFHCSSIHELFYGTADFVFYDEPARTLHVWDFKYGAGIVVEAERNAQTMYYACGALEDLDLWADASMVVLHIAQPRAWHMDGPIRRWSITTTDLETWLLDELVPAMERALVSRETKTGEHCRFCPVRSHKCPALWGDIKNLEKLMGKAEASGGVASLTNAEVCKLLDLGETFKIARAAALKTGTARAMKGLAIAAPGSEGWKLAKAKSNRGFKPDAEKAAVKKWGKDRAFTKPVLKSPAQIDNLPGGEAFTARYAEKPDKGLTLVRGTDTRPAVTKEKAASVFKDRSSKKGKAK
jgi:hypothetical protein